MFLVSVQVRMRNLRKIVLLNIICNIFSYLINYHFLHRNSFHDIHCGQALYFTSKGHKVRCTGNSKLIEVALGGFRSIIGGAASENQFV